MKRALDVLRKWLAMPVERLRDADGNEWDVLLSPPGRSRRAGLTGDEVQVGDVVYVDPDHFDKMQTKLDNTPGPFSRIISEEMW